MRRYNIINNSLGWFCFLVAAVTYLLTIEPTASFWDCPEFISQGANLEVGHPPGNPIFILTARFFINFAGGDAAGAAIAVNVMSALLSAATILLLFWTITHLVRRLIVGAGEDRISTAKMIVIMGSGLCGALLYTWSDTFWFSAVEGEVYAFSSFCTALVFWLILKWESRADKPHSDRYLIFVAFIIGISIAVHLLNLLTIPALGMVIYYRKAKKVNFLGATLALIGSFVVVGLILYGLVPGFVEIAQYFELFFVNTLHMSYNMGVLIYAIILVSMLIWCVVAIYRQKSVWQIKQSFILSVVLSGIPFIGSSIIIPIIITAALTAYLLLAKRLSIRLLNLAALSILVIFVGYSSYALLLIRSHANPPMNQNAPDNVFALGSYLNREQYGQTPLFYGPSFSSEPSYTVSFDYTGQPVYRARTTEVPKGYGKVVKTDPSDPDKYVELKPRKDYDLYPKMIFPRMYSQQPGHPEAYLKWIGETMETLPEHNEQILFDDKDRPFRHPSTGDVIEVPVPAPSFGQNLRYFFRYQLGYMYWRYFMWNFAGRQNDLQGQGELNRGNWISGIPFIDNARLGDQSLLPPEYGSANKGHNVFYMLPLLMGLLGIAAQLLRGREGTRQFWVIFLLFFMTGIAIVFYLNQPPNQPRERDYAFAGSFYAFAIWIGLGVTFFWLAAKSLARKAMEKSKVALTVASAAAVIGLIIPLQVVSQTWDDHDRSGRYAARDFGMNYLSSLDENAVIFTNGDNDTFPLWYAQEVEGYRRDVRVVNLAYLTTDWYANHMKMPAYNAAAIDFSAQPADYAHDRLQNSIVDTKSESGYVSLLASLNDLYTNPDSYDEALGYRIMKYPKVYIPVDGQEAIRRGIISPSDSALYSDYIQIDLSNRASVTLGDVLALDIVANGSSDSWKRPTYFASTVPNELYVNLDGYLQNTGLTYQVTPVFNPDASQGEIAVNTDKMYDNVMNRFRWGGLDSGDDLYLDETIRRMVTTHRSALVELAEALYKEGYNVLYDYDAVSDPADVLIEIEATDPGKAAYVRDRYDRAVKVLDLIDTKLPKKQSPFSIQIAQQIGRLYTFIGSDLRDTAIKQKGIGYLKDDLQRFAGHIPYLKSLLDREKRDRLEIIKQLDIYDKNDLQKLVDMTNLNAADIRRLGTTGLGSLSLDAVYATTSSLNVNSIDRYVPTYVETLVCNLLEFDVPKAEIKKILAGAGTSLTEILDVQGISPRVLASINLDDDSLLDVLKAYGIEWRRILAEEIQEDEE